MQAILEQDLVLVHDTAIAYAERTLGDFWKLSPTEQRKELEKYKEKSQ